MIRFILRNSVSLFFLALLLSCFFITSTETGLKVGARAVTHFIPEITIQEVKGKLFSKFSLHTILYKDKQNSIKIDSVDVAWSPIALLNDKLVIDNLTLHNTKLHIQQSKSDKSSDINFENLKKIILKQFVIDKLTLQLDNSLIEVNGQLTDKWQVAWRVNIPQINQLSPAHAGSINSSGTITGPQWSPTIHAFLEGNQLAFKENKLDKINLELLSQLVYKKPALQTDLTLKLFGNYKIDGHFAFPNFTSINDLNQSVTGKINFNSDQIIKLIAQFTDLIKNPTGELKGEISVNGKLNNPSISGKVNLMNGKVTIPTLGLTLEKIHLQATNATPEQVNYQGSFQSGAGLGQLHGTVNIKDPNYPGTLTLNGTDLQVANLAEYKVNASPNLQLNFDTKTVQIQGSILVPKATFAPKSFESTVTLPQEVVIVEQKKSETPAFTNLTMNINLQLGNDIHISFKELQTQVGGKIQINSTPNSLPTAIGELHTINGSYHAYGQTLKIKEGKLIFAGGPLMNPGLNIRAAKEVKILSVDNPGQFDNATSAFKPVQAENAVLTIGIQIDGSFDRPVISLFSSPSKLSNEDILSYLLFGHSQSYITANQNRMLLSAASTLTSGNGKSKLSTITENIQNKLGLSEMTIESTETFNPNTGSVNSTTSFVVGKQLSKKLYAHYSIGLFDPISVLNLRYKLSKRFSIQSETSSVDSGADLLYSIERD